MVGPVDEDACLSAGARLCVSANPSASELDAIVRCAEVQKRRQKTHGFSPLLSFSMKPYPPPRRGLSLNPVFSCQSHRSRSQASSRSLTAGPTKTTGASVSLLKRLVSAPPHAAPRPLGGAPGGQKDPVPLIEWMRINLRAAGEPGAQQVRGGGAPPPSSTDRPPHEAPPTLRTLSAQTALRKALRVFTRVLTSVDEAHQRGEPLGTINPRSVAVDRLMQVSTARPDRSAPAATPLAPTPSTSRRSSSPPPAVSRVPSLSAAHRDVLSAAAHVPRGTAASDTPSEASDAPMAPASDLAYVCPSSAPAGISPPSASADVFALGVLLLDLLWHVTAPATASQSDREAFLESARERVLDPWVFERFPRESAVAMRMIHPLPCQRPSTKEVLSSPVLLEVRASDSKLEWCSSHSSGLMMAETDSHASSLL